MAYCRSCGTEMADDATFCSKCGANQQAASAPAPQPQVIVIRRGGGQVAERGTDWVRVMLGIVLFLILLGVALPVCGAVGIGTCTLLR